MRPQVRLATADDLCAIEQCAKAAYEKYIDRIGQTPAPMVADFATQIKNKQVFVLVSDTTFVGYVVCYIVGDSLHLENVAVLPDQAGKGFGKHLISHAEAFAKESSLGFVELYTNEAMVENIQMYPKLGYTEVERKQQDGFQRVFYRKGV